MPSKGSSAPDLIDIMTLWFEETNSGHIVSRKTDKGSHRQFATIQGGLILDDNIGYIFVTDKSWVEIIRARGPYSEGIFRPEDPAFFDRLRRSLGINDARTDA